MHTCIFFSVRNVVAIVIENTWSRSQRNRYSIGYTIAVAVCLYRLQAAFPVRRYSRKKNILLTAIANTNGISAGGWKPYPGILSLTRPSAPNMPVGASSSVGQRADSTGVGDHSAVHPTPATPVGTHLAAHLALTQAVRLVVPEAAGTLCRTGPAVPSLRESPSRLPGGHAGPRPRDRRVCAQAAAVVPATHWHHPRGSGRTGGSVDRRRRPGPGGAIQPGPCRRRRIPCSASCSMGCAIC